MIINYIKGDATSPQGDGNKIIAHICNDMGGWGRGFVLAISAKWSLPESSYRAWSGSGSDFVLGNMQLVQVETDTWVANIIGQKGIKKDQEGLPPVRYEAIRSGLTKLCLEADRLSASVHMPRIGCGLAGGSWEMMEPIIAAELVNKGIAVTVYDL